MYRYSVIRDQSKCIGYISRVLWKICLCPPLFSKKSIRPLNGPGPSTPYMLTRRGQSSAFRRFMCICMCVSLCVSMTEWVCVSFFLFEAAAGKSYFQLICQMFFAVTCTSFFSMEKLSEICAVKERPFLFLYMQKSIKNTATLFFYKKLEYPHALNSFLDYAQFLDQAISLFFFCKNIRNFRLKWVKLNSKNDKKCQKCPQKVLNGWMGEFSHEGHNVSFIIILGI